MVVLLTLTPTLTHIEAEDDMIPTRQSLPHQNKQNGNALKQAKMRSFLVCVVGFCRVFPITINQYKQIYALRSHVQSYFEI